ncbi:MAG: isopentenyl-diphosphate Delta-isomerase [Geminicoccaceae bacterium]|nr:isopentenyl-diphosphate Delta-isomerase [Geminicoccaceae bacterium]HRY23916.1 isopentenyl-diphosphate Delta-isomerase [Geminicoccaceae bacterium]
MPGMPDAPAIRPNARIDTELVMLVDVEDRVIGTAEKHAAHRSGALHRAFSVLIHNPAGNWLLQRRSPGKYHSGGLWTNAACGHPRPGEATEAAAGRRLEEELGFVCPLAYVTRVHYRSPLDHGMTEHELVSIYTGRHEGPVEPDPVEADAVRWIEPQELRRDMDAHPDRYTVWFRKYVTELWATLHAA